MALFGGGEQGLNITIKAKDEASAKINNVFSSVTNLAKGFALGELATHGLEAGFRFLTDQISSTIAAYSESEKVTAQTNAVLESTGYAAGYTAEQIQQMATALEQQTTYSDEAVKSAENLLLTFTNIGHDTFPAATQAVLDMSVALGQDTKDSAIQLGKALQDPILGVTALRRVGVNFSESQTELIKKMVESGNVMGAQKYILHELGTEFGGSATAQAKTFAGQVQQMKNRLDDAKEEIGHGLTPILGNLISTMGDSAAAMMGNANTAELVFNSFRNVVEVTALLATKFLQLGGAAVKAASYVGELVSITSLWDKSQRKSFEDQRTAADNMIAGSEDAFQKLIDKNAASAASFKQMEEQSGKALAGMKTSFGGVAAASDSAVKKIADAHKKLQDEIQKTKQVSVDELAALAKAHDDAATSSIARINDIKKSIQDLVVSYDQAASKAASAFGKENTSDRKGIAEQVAAEEKKIADLKLQAGNELNPEKKLQLQDQLKKEQDAYAANAEFIASIQAEVDAARIRAGETDFQRAIDDFVAKRAQAQQEYDANRAEALAEFTAKKRELQRDLDAETNKMNAEVDKYESTRAQILELTNSASKIRLETTLKTTDAIIAAVDKEIAKYNALAEAIQRAAQGKPGIVSTSSKISSHEFGGTVPGAVGEPVAIIAHGQEQVIPAGQTTKGGAGVFTINIINPTVRNDSDIAAFRTQMEEAFRDITRGHKLATI